MLRTPLAIALLGCLAACSLPPAIHGSGTIRAENREIPGFHAIEISGSGWLILSQSGKGSLTIECDDNLLPHIQSQVQEGTLKLGFESGDYRPTKQTIFRVSVAELDRLEIKGGVRVESPSLKATHLEIEVSGSGDLQIGSLEADQFVVDTSGSSQLEIAQLTAKSLRYNTSGSGTLRAGGGSLVDLSVNCGGSSRVHLEEVPTQKADVRISGSGEVSLWAMEALTSKISGSAQIHYRGTPAIDTQVSGSGRVQPLEEQPAAPKDTSER